MSDALTELLADRLSGPKAADQEVVSEEPVLRAAEFTTGRLGAGAHLVQRVVAVNQ